MALSQGLVPFTGEEGEGNIGHERISEGVPVAGEAVDSGIVSFTLSIRENNCFWEAIVIFGAPHTSSRKAGKIALQYPSIVVTFRYALVVRHSIFQRYRGGFSASDRESCLENARVRFLA